MKKPSKASAPARHDAPQPYLAGSIGFRAPGGEPLKGVVVTRDAGEVIIQDHRGPQPIEMRFNVGYAERLETLIRDARNHKERP